MGALEVFESANNMPIAATHIIGNQHFSGPVVEENQITIRMKSSYVLGCFEWVVPLAQKVYHT
jgi:hypothetical protein